MNQPGVHQLTNFAYENIRVMTIVLFTKTIPSWTWKQPNKWHHLDLQHRSSYYIVILKYKIYSIIKNDSWYEKHQNDNEGYYSYISMYSTCIRTQLSVNYGHIQNMKWLDHYYSFEHLSQARGALMTEWCRQLVTLRLWGRTLPCLR